MHLFVECIFSVSSMRAGTGVLASSLLSSQLPKLYPRNLQASKSLYVLYQSQENRCLVWIKLRKLLFWHFLPSSKYFVFAKAGVWNSKANNRSLCSPHSAVSTFCRGNGREVWGYRNVYEGEGTTQILTPPHICSQHLPQRWHLFPMTSGSCAAVPRFPFHDWRSYSLGSLGILPADSYQLGGNCPQ